MNMYDPHLCYWIRICSCVIITADHQHGSPTAQEVEANGRRVRYEGSISAKTEESAAVLSRVALQPQRNKRLMICWSKPKLK